MTLDEAIERYEDNAEYERTHGNLQGCLEFKQLAKLLKELRAYRKIYHKEHVDDCLRAESEMKEYGFAECIIDTVKAYFDNAQTTIEADRSEE